ncbi:MAG: bifunctional metallophosphatase/5'-nucleotidase, partial [Fibrobacteraceae bacterium]
MFTHDLHSHYVPFRVEEADSGKEMEGGYARLFTVISKEKETNPSSNLLVDAGDFSIGTIFHTLFRTQAMGFRLL